MATVPALRETRWQDSRLWGNRRLRPEGGSALCLDLRAADHRLQQLLRRQPPGADGLDRAGQAETGYRPRAAARGRRRRSAPDRGAGSLRQGRRHALAGKSLAADGAYSTTRSACYQGREGSPSPRPLQHEFFWFPRLSLGGYLAVCTLARPRSANNDFIVPYSWTRFLRKSR